MTVNTEDTSRQSPIRTGEVELLEFFAQRRASDDREREIRVPMSGRWCGARNALLTMMPLWLALACWLAR
jgi:hypothetical protein